MVEVEDEDEDHEKEEAAELQSCQKLTFLFAESFRKDKIPRGLFERSGNPAHRDCGKLQFGGFYFAV